MHQSTADLLCRKVKLFEVPVGFAQTHQARWSPNVEGQSKHPAVVHICRESRNEALRYYTICQDRPRFSDSFMGYKANVYFINFAVDTFVNGSSRYTYRSRRLPAAGGHNFEASILTKVKRIEHLPCYQGPVFDYEKIYHDSAYTIKYFRQDHWESLREVTMIVDDVCFAELQETVDFHLFLDEFQSKLKKYIAADRNRIRHVDGSFRGFTKMKFEIHAKWKYIRGDEEQDLVPCKPYGLLDSPWLGIAKHYPCVKHLKHLEDTYGTQST